jgi:hypothetical protein
LTAVAVILNSHVNHPHTDDCRATKRSLTSGAPARLGSSRPQLSQGGRQNTIHIGSSAVYPI